MLSRFSGWAWESLLLFRLREEVDSERKGKGMSGEEAGARTAPGEGVGAIFSDGWTSSSSSDCLYPELYPEYALSMPNVVYRS